MGDDFSPIHCPRLPFILTYNSLRKIPPPIKPANELALQSVTLSYDPIFQDIFLLANEMISSAPPALEN